jgi:hypothetical protein
MLLATVSQAPYCRGGVRQAIGDMIATLFLGFVTFQAVVAACGVTADGRPYRKPTGLPRWQPPKRALGEIAV